MKLHLRCTVLLLGTALLAPVPSHAIAAFARKYGVNCSTCHTGFARLNDFGQRYRDGGYQIPGQTGGEKGVFELAPPLAMRMSSGVSVYRTTGSTASGFNVFGLDLLAAGVLRKDLSFLLIYQPPFDDPAADSARSAGSRGPAQAGTLESANLVVSNLVTDLLSLRVGRFEPAYHPFSDRRRHNLFAPYEVYAFTTPGNTFVCGDNQTGIEATGHAPSGFKYGVGVVNRSGTQPDQNNAKDPYVRLLQTFGKGDGQSAGQRLGTFAYHGWQPTRVPGTPFSPTGEADGKESQPFYRAGMDASLNYRAVNPGLLLLRGVDDQHLNPGSARDYAYTGGLAEVSWTGATNNRLVASATYNWVRPPWFDANRKVDAFAALLRYYHGDWSAVNVASHAEYVFRRTGKDSAVNEHQLAFVVDLSF